MLSRKAKRKETANANQKTIKRTKKSEVIFFFHQKVESLVKSTRWNKKTIRKKRHK